MKILPTSQGCNPM